MSAKLVHRGPDSDGIFAEGHVALAARRLAIIDLETGDQPIANEDGRPRRPERRALQLPRAARRARARRPPLPHARRHRGARPPLRAGGLEFVRRLRGMFAVALWDCAAAAPRARPRPLRDQAALLPCRLERRPRVRLRAARAPARGDRPRRARGVPRLQLDSRAADDLPRRAQASARAPAGLGGRRDARSSDSHALRLSAARRPARRRRSRADRGAARPAPRLRARAPRLRRAGRRAPLGRNRLLRAHRPGRAGEPRAGADVLDRLRGALLRRARRRAASRRAVWHAASRARAAARRRAAPAGARGGLRRAVRRLVRAADLPRLAASRRRT